jgi:hypothetical protein
MQKYSAYLAPRERTVVRKWRLRVAAFYGSIIVVLLLLSAIVPQGPQTARQDRASADLVTPARPR